MTELGATRLPELNYNFHFDLSHNRSFAAHCPKAIEENMLDLLNHSSGGYSMTETTGEVSGMKLTVKHTIPTSASEVRTLPVLV